MTTHAQPGHPGMVSQPLQDRQLEAVCIGGAQCQGHNDVRPDALVDLRAGGVESSAGEQDQRAGRRGVQDGPVSFGYLTVAPGVGSQAGGFDLHMAVHAEVGQVPNRKEAGRQVSVNSQPLLAIGPFHHDHDQQGCNQLEHLFANSAQNVIAPGNPPGQSMGQVIEKCSQFFTPIISSVHEHSDPFRSGRIFS